MAETGEARAVKRARVQKFLGSPKPYNAEELLATEFHKKFMEEFNRLLLAKLKKIFARQKFPMHAGDTVRRARRPAGPKAYDLF
jgi:hypothetical protein